MPDKQACLICYDIHDPKRLRHVARATEGHALRVQRSVFEAWLSRDHQTQWRQAVAPHTRDGDALFCLHLCPRCVRRVHVIGQGPGFADPGAVLI